MPAAAVIPAPVAYIKVVAVKTLVVGSRAGKRGGPAETVGCFVAHGFSSWMATLPLNWGGVTVWGVRLSVLVARSCTLKKMECSKQALLP